jgi:UDP-2,3-diacylglucosamine pyrophosphatase LpxH
VASSAHNLIVLSDVHLGSDLVHHAQPNAPRRARASELRSRELVAFFEHYREHPLQGRPWKLVFAGDFMDFVGMSVLPDIELDTAPNSEELAHGLGGAPDHALAKLDLVMSHDAPVMQALALFLAAGNSMVIVRGNHDVDWHWEAVQERFCERLAEHATFRRDQLEFMPWFYYEEGVVFVEHGHQYDAYCSFEHVLHPVSPLDPRRTARSLSDVLLRYVVRPTRGMTEAGHAAASALTYFRFAVGLGINGMFTLARRFIAATRALVDLWREHVSEGAQRIRQEQERRILRLAELHRIQIERLRALLHLQRPPITKSLLAIFASVMLDRIFLVLVGALSVLAVLLAVPSPSLAWPVALGVTLVLFALGVAWRRLREALEPSAELRERSAVVARLFPAAFIVMGHTHLPETRATTEHATYVNLGAWAEDDVDDGRAPGLPATRTHLVLVHGGEGEPRGELLKWSASGPEPYGSKGANPKSG